MKWSEDSRPQINIYSSPDGIHFKPTYQGVLTYRSEGHQLDTQNIIFWDPRIFQVRVVTWQGNEDVSTLVRQFGGVELGQ